MKIFCSKVSLMTLLALIVHGALLREVLASLRIPEDVGVCTYALPPDDELRLLQEAGVHWLRTHFYWSKSEREKGVYNFLDFEKELYTAEKYKMRSLITIEGGNALYEGKPEGPWDLVPPPKTEEARKAFIKWAVELVQHFKGHGFIWEFSNEPNDYKSWPTPAGYHQYARELGRALKKKCPGEILVGPATAPQYENLPASVMDFDFLEGCFRAGLLEYWDAVAVHPYLWNFASPEAVSEGYQKLRKLIDHYAPKGTRIGIINTEVGYPHKIGTGDPSSVGGGTVSEEIQAQILTRQFLVDLMNEIRGTFWYMFHDNEPGDWTAYCGLLRLRKDQTVKPSPKPAYEALKAFTNALKNYRFIKRLPVGNSRDYVLLFRSDDSRKVRLAVWTTSKKSRSLAIPASEGSFKIVNHLGKIEPSLKSGNKDLLILATESPHYVIPEGPNKKLEEY